jgi:hypothetical protein
MKNIYLKLKDFFDQNVGETIIITLIAGALVVSYFYVKLHREEFSQIIAPTVQTVPQNTSKKLTDSLVQVYQNYKSENVFLKKQVSNLLIDKNTLTLQYNLLKFQKNKLNQNEKNIKYISDKNSSVQSALDSISSIVTRNPIHFPNQ